MKINLVRQLCLWKVVFDHENSEYAKEREFKAIVLIQIEGIQQLRGQNFAIFCPPPPPPRCH